MSKLVAILVTAVLTLGCPRAVGGQALFDSTTIRTERGIVVEVHRTPQGTDGSLVFFTLRTQAETLAVRLGPGGVLDRSGIVFAPGDTLEVTGSRVLLFDEPTILVTELRRGTRVLALRDRRGRPVW